MAQTLNIPLTTVAVGTRDFGPINLADTDTQAVLTIDRTVAGGFNSLTSATTCEISFFQSDDSGSTWTQVAAATFSGGIQTNSRGQVNSNDVGSNFFPGTGRQARAEIKIGGTSVAVQGSLVIT